MTVLRSGTYLTPSIPVDVFETILQYLESKLKIHTTLLYESRSHGPKLDIEDPFASGHLDLAWMTSSAYLKLADSANSIELLPVAPVHKHPIGDGCFTDIIIHKDLKEVAKEFLDLRGYGFAFDTPHSFNSEIITLLNLKDLGENQSFFKGVSYSGSHLESIRAVIAKKAEAAAVDANCLSFFLERNPHLADEIDILTSWGPLPPYACVVRSSLSDTLKSDIVECLCNMHRDEDGKKRLSKFSFNIDHFRQVKSEDFQKAATLEKRFKGTGRTNTYY